MRWADLQMEKGYFGLSAYCQSKLALALFIREFARRAPPDSGIVACAADPGLVRTEIGRKGTDSLTRTFWALWSRRGIPAAESAAGIAALAGAEGIPSGEYWVRGEVVPASKRSRSEEDASRLWEISQALCGIRFLSN
jgi:retinol dehydrogenase-12